MLTTLEGFLKAVSSCFSGRGMLRPSRPQGTSSGIHEEKGEDSTGIRHRRFPLGLRGGRKNRTMVRAETSRTLSVKSCQSLTNWGVGEEKKNHYPDTAAVARGRE